MRGFHGNYIPVRRDYRGGETSGPAVSSLIQLTFKEASVHSRILTLMGMVASMSAFAALTLSAGVARARPDDKDKPRYERFDLKIREDFFAGLRGDRERLANGMKLAEATIKKNPKHAEALSWHGS